MLARRSELSRDQKVAFEMIKAWWRCADRPSRPFFKLFGYAGTGKTTLAQVVARLLTANCNNVVFACPTGKAASVLAKKTGREVSTIHRLAYQLTGADKKGKPTFDVLDEDRSPISEAHILIIDECSMVNQKMMTDLLSFDVPVLAIGDPGQLPPVEGVPFFQTDPDAMLETIHRQAADNPIIDLATKIRHGEDYGDVNGTVQFLKLPLAGSILMAADQVICGKNSTRKRANKFIRKQLKFDSDLPQVHDRVVCLKNNHDLGIYNGEIFCVVDIDYAGISTNSAPSKGGGFVAMTVMDELGQRYDMDRVAVAPFRGSKPAYHDTYDTNYFDFGYCLTVHKSQGSEWDNVVVIDDGLFVQDKDFHRQWLYTAATRASEKLTIVE